MMSREDKQRYLNNRRYVFGNSHLWLTNNDRRYNSIREAMECHGPADVLYIYDFKGELMHALDVRTYAHNSNLYEDGRWHVRINDKLIEGGEWDMFIVKICLELEEQADEELQVRIKEQLAG